MTEPNNNPTGQNGSTPNQMPGQTTNQQTSQMPGQSTNNQPTNYPPTPGAAYTQPAQPVQPAQPQQKRKVWPWVLLACLLAFLLGMGGCAGCAAVGMLVGTSTAARDGSLHLYDYDDYPYGYNNNSGSNSGSNSNSSSSDTYGGFTMDDIKNAADGLSGDIEDGKAASGCYVVGRDIAAGSYFMQGMTTEESNFYIFTPEGSGTYSLKASIVYVGHYFYDLEEGQVIVYIPAGNDLRMIPSDQADFHPQAPYSSGLYRVGTDIPAGTYTVSVASDAPSSPSQEYAAYIMKDLEFNDDSILETKYLLKGQSQTITVEDGQLVELFGCTATPTN